MPGSWVAALWRGEIPLAKSFWEYAILYGTLLNLIATIAAFGVLAAGGSILLAGAVYLLPLPYNLTVIVGVWRSAAVYPGDRRWADWARVAVVVWAALAVLL